MTMNALMFCESKKTRPIPNSMMPPMENTCVTQHTTNRSPQKHVTMAYIFHDSLIPQHNSRNAMDMKEYRNQSATVQ